MVRAVIALSRFFTLFLALSALSAPVRAHRLDEYLQATLVSIEPETVRFQINLTPGIAVADQLIALIDANRDGLISTNESAAYVERFKHQLTARLDNRKIELNLVKTQFPPLSDFASGAAIIQVEFAANIAPLAAGAHRLKLENRHMPLIGVYLFNAAPPRLQSISIAKQIRNKTQSVGEIEFTYRAAVKP